MYAAAQGRDWMQNAKPAGLKPPHSVFNLRLIHSHGAFF
jgi:hypothetical protein